MRNICSVDYCERYVHGRGFCSAHWNRLRRYGDPLGSKPRPIGRRIQKVAVDHPLSGAQGKVRRARLVLYEKLVGKNAPCHWCGEVMEWRTGPEARRRGSLVVDHLDSDTQNDDPDNLVPACIGCNANRERGRWINKNIVCSTADCNLQARSQGLCSKHASQRWREQRSKE